MLTPPSIPNPVMAFPVGWSIDQLISYMEEELDDVLATIEFLHRAEYSSHMMAIIMPLHKESSMLSHNIRYYEWRKETGWV